MSNAVTPELIAERKRLADEYAHLDVGGFPGSKAWSAASAAGMALHTFDVAHPEVLRAIRNADRTPLTDEQMRAL